VATVSPVDRFRLWGLCTAAVFILSLIVGSFMLLLIWLIVSAEAAVVLGTGLRGWLEIRERRDPASRNRRTELNDQDLDLMDQGLEPLEP
jgi:predicted tellurium resistance membrane protein TerC